MPSRLDRTAFLSEPTRLKIAEFCREEPHSVVEIARELGRSTGSLSQPETMLKKKALKSARRKGADDRGGTTVFRLAADWVPALEEARSRRQPELPATGQELLLIPLAQTAAACAVIADGIDEVEWAAEVSGESVGLLVAPRVDRSGANTLRVLSALGSAGEQARRIHLRTVMSPARLREWAAEVAGGEGPPRELSGGRR